MVDRVKYTEVNIEYCLTDDMLGYYFTKALQVSKFRKLREKILNVPPRNYGLTPTDGD